MSNTNMPRWAELVVLPIVCLAVALAVAGVVVALIGQDPMVVLSFLIYGALGTARGVSYTLYYTPRLSLPAWPWPWPFTAACSTLVEKAKPSWAVWAQAWWRCGCHPTCQLG